MSTFDLCSAIYQYNLLPVDLDLEKNVLFSDSFTSTNFKSLRKFVCFLSWKIYGTYRLDSIFLKYLILRFESLNNRVYLLKKDEYKSSFLRVLGKCLCRLSSE